MAGGPSIRLYRAEWSTNCERVGLALAHKGNLAAWIEPVGERPRAY